MKTHWNSGCLLVCACLMFTGCDKVKETPKPGPSEAASAVHVPELNDSTFGSQPAPGVMLVDFWAPWCGPCRTQGPILEKAAAQIGASARVFKVNVDNAPQTAQKYGVSSIPTLIVFKNGKPVKQFVGVTQADDLVAAVQAAQ